MSAADCCRRCEATAFEECCDDDEETEVRGAAGASSTAEAPERGARALECELDAVAREREVDEEVEAADEIAPAEEALALPGGGASIEPSSRGSELISPRMR